MKQFCISILSLLIMQQLLSQTWAPLGSDERTSNSIVMTAASTFFTQVSNDGVPYISYIDDAFGNDNHNLGDFKVHAKRFLNGQWQFAGDGISPSFPGSDDFPVALDGNLPYVAYSEAFTPVAFQNKLSVKKLNSNTNKWELVGQQGLSDSSATGTVMAIDNGIIYVAYSDGGVDSKVTVKQFDNAHPADGWTTVGARGFSNGFVLGINIAIDNGIPYVAYLDFADNILHVKKFNGTDWADVGTNNPTGGPQLIVVVRSLKFDSHHLPYIAFVDSDGNGIVRNLNAANLWVTTSGQPFATGVANPVSLHLLNDIPFVAFGKNINGLAQIHVKRLDAGNNNWPDAGNQPVTAGNSPANNVALVSAGGNKLLLVFRTMNAGIYAKTFDAGSVLPVTLTSFSVSRQNGKNILQWTASAGPDDQLFEIEHSRDAVSFNKIGETAIQLPAGILHDYSFIHTAPLEGINYYRLKQVNNNGNFTYSGIISITVNRQDQPFITLSPNPVKNLLHAATLLAGEKNIVIRNTAGSIMKQLKTTATSVDINIEALAAGTYFISIYSGKIIDSRSFIKQ